MRAYGKDGRSYLLDYGRFPAQPGFPELRTYLNTQLFTTLAGVSSPIYKCYVDIQGTRWYDAIDLCLAEPGRVIATAGAKESLQTTDRVWPVKVNAKSGRPLYCLYFDHNFWAGRLYRETIQHFDPKRHRPLRSRHLLRIRHRRRLFPRTHAGTRGLEEPENDLGESQPERRQ